MTYQFRKPSNDGKAASMTAISATASASDANSPPKTGVRKLVLTAAGWSMGGYAVSQVLRIGSNLLLARLLAPEVFGLAAVAAMVALIVALLSDIGLHQAVIQNARGDEPEFLDTAWVMQIIRGMLIWIGCIAVAMAIAYMAAHEWVSASSVYAAPQLPMVIIVSSFGVVITGFQSTKYLTSYRQLGLNRITMIELYGQIGGTLVGIVLAWLTHSVWACIAIGLTAAMIVTLLSHVWLPGRENRFRMDRDSALELLRFGRWLMVSSFFTILAVNGDRILLGNWSNSHTFGLYTLAFSLVAMLDGVGARLHASVGTPILSKIAREDRQGLRAFYLKLRAPFDLFYLCCAGGIFACGQLIVDVLYDSRYAGAGAMIQILSFSLITARFGIMTSVYVAIGEPRYVGILNFVRAALLFIAMPLCYWLFGFNGALWAIALYALPTIPLIFIYNSRHRLNSFTFELLVLLAWPVGYWLGHLVLETAARFYGAVL